MQVTIPRDISVMIATHTHGTVTPGYAQSLAVLTGHLGAWRVSHSVLIVEDAFVDRGRDRAAAHFLASDQTHLLFVDADVQFQPADVARLLAARLPLVAGAYRYKDESGQFAVSFPEDAMRGCAWHDEVRAVSVDGVGAGFMLIAREVFEAVRAATPDLAYRAKGASGALEDFHGYFDQDREQGQRVGEDIAFCRRWRACGGQVWVVPDLRLTHWGRTPYEGALSEQMRVEPGGVAAE